MKLVERGRTSVKILNPELYFENYEIIANFPFTSETKKMSVLVRSLESGRYIYFAKGAEVVMEPKIKS
jgi:phospholipid-translocating ATPase